MADSLSESQSGTIETRKDLGAEPDATFSYWSGQEKIAEKEERKWYKQADRIIQRYRDERSDALREANRFNILWSNVQTLIPTLYARTPKADVERRFRDDDPVGRLASILLERAITYSADHFDFDDMMLAVTEDRLLPGRGTARVLYIPHFGDEIKSATPALAAPTTKLADSADTDNDNDEFEQTGEQGSTVDNTGDEPPLREVTYEEVKSAYVFWKDYREGPARKWGEVPWVRYRSYLTLDELTDRFGKAKAKQVNLDFTPKGSSSNEKENPPPDMFKKAIIHEYWDKTKKQVIWIAPGTPDLILDTVDDPLKLPDFFPSPNPCFATTTNDKRVPVPDYVEYQDQARELDTLTGRIDVLTKALAVKGIYPGENKQALQQLFDTGDNQLVPILDWMAFAQNGNLKDMIQYLPIEQVAQTLIQLYNARDKVKGLLYEITGISDILRGETNPDETATSQELKSNFATRRITPQQKRIAQFSRDMFRLMGGVIAEHFSPKTISMITGYPQLKPVPQLPPPPQMPAQQLQLALPAPPQPGAQPGSAPGQPGQMNGAPAQPAGAVPGGAGAPTNLPGAPAAPQPPSPQMQAYQQAMAQWQQAAQQVQALTQANQQKQAEFDAAVALIKSDGVHGFRIDIEADSTIAPDEQAEKTSRTEFMQQFVPFMETLVPIAQGNPKMAELAKEFALFTVRGWRVARSLEETISNAFDEVAQMPPNPKATGQDGKQPTGGSDPAELAAKVHETETRAATETQTAQVNAAAQTQKSSDAVTIAREKNITLLQIQNQKTQQANDQAAAEEPHKAAQLALEAQRVSNERDIAQARQQAVETRSANNLQ
jgi:hypothetical protein